jgi:hypothetical protein
MVTTTVGSDQKDNEYVLRLHLNKERSDREINQDQERNDSGNQSIVIMELIKSRAIVETSAER